MNRHASRSIRRAASASALAMPFLLTALRRRWWWHW